MKISVEQKEFVSILAKTQNIVERKNTMPVLINVLLETSDEYLKVFATDLEVSLTGEIQSENSRAGKCVVNAKHLFDIVKEFQSGKLSLETKENNRIEISQNKAVFNLVGVNPDEYPVFPTFSTTEFLRVNADYFREMIEKTIYSVANDDTRYQLNGVYFERLALDDRTIYRMVATDGHRLSLVDREAEIASPAGSVPFQGVIIPRKGLSEVKKVIETTDSELQLAVEGSQLIFKCGHTVLMVRLIEGRYPDYNRLIPKNLSLEATVGRETLLSCLKRVSLMSNQKSKGVTLSLNEGRLEISSNNPDLGDAKEELEVNYDGDELKIGFNARYILDVLNSIEDENIQIMLNDQMSPGLMKPSGDGNHTCVVMPMRI